MNIYLIVTLIAVFIVGIEIAIKIYTKKRLNAINGMSKLYVTQVDNIGRIMGHFE